MAAPKKAVGPKSDKIWRDAIMKAVRRHPNDPTPRYAQRLDVLADVLVARGIEGDNAAAKEIGDRLDGKPAQSIGLGQAEDLKPLEASIRPPMTRDEWLKTHQK